jgi:hypothetical protein
LFRSVQDDAWFSSTGELQIPHFVRDDNPFQVASGVICRDPKARFFIGPCVARLKSRPSRSWRGLGRFAALKRRATQKINCETELLRSVSDEA